mmetsp:Transcript_19479/g.74717  ORF Transcript_19479/g.74717 Transcript_19479/m.74717 type:complete len:334 (-) Transcript_19479:1504-2505(-)
MRDPATSGGDASALQVPAGAVRRHHVHRRDAAELLGPIAGRQGRDTRVTLSDGPGGGCVSKPERCCGRGVGAATGRCGPCHDGAAVPNRRHNDDPCSVVHQRDQRRGSGPDAARARQQFRFWLPVLDPLHAPAEGRVRFLERLHERWAHLGRHRPGTRPRGELGEGWEHKVVQPRGHVPGDELGCRAPGVSVEHAIERHASLRRQERGVRVRTGTRQVGVVHELADALAAPHAPRPHTLAFAAECALVSAMLGGGGLASGRRGGGCRLLVIGAGLPLVPEVLLRLSLDGAEQKVAQAGALLGGRNAAPHGGLGYRAEDGTAGPALPLLHGLEP